ncbi:MAG: hypothetical protein VX293_09500 [Candidatus Latescibacterota bacterium]|nr:hypothetical protein [Candidatus Latescibacterota bacterium]
MSQPTAQDLEATLWQEEKIFLMRHYARLLLDRVEADEELDDRIVESLLVARPYVDSELASRIADLLSEHGHEETSQEAALEETDLATNTNPPTTGTDSALRESGDPFAGVEEEDETESLFDEEDDDDESKTGSLFEDGEDDDDDESEVEGKAESLFGDDGEDEEEDESKAESLFEDDGMTP